MIPKTCQRLAEVDFPIAEVSRHAAREKSIRHGHPSTLHLWWARRPLASSRAVLLALLLPDPADPHCPAAFKEPARKALLAMQARPSGWNELVQTDEGLRQALLKFIADFANWDNAARPEYLNTGRALVRAAHPEETPLVVDPFAGGGSIPLEALRLGCEAFASDLNPVACLILKVMLEDIPRQGPGLADQLRQAGAAIKAQAERELADLYPQDPDGATPIAYLWARTVRCEAPDCGAEIPLLRSLWLCKKANRRRALRSNVMRDDQTPPTVVFEIFEPRSEGEVAKGTVARAKATCLCCHTVLPPPRVRTQLAAQQGGADVVFDQQGQRTGGARLTAVVTLKSTKPGRHYRLPIATDYGTVRKAQEQVAKLLEAWQRNDQQELCPVPDEPLPPIGTLGFRVQRYGMTQWGDLFTARQKAVLVETSRLLSSSGEILGLSFGKMARHYNVLSKWHTGSETVAGAFGMQTLPMSWDFPEMFPIVSYAGGIENAIADVVGGAEAIPPILAAGQVQLADAAYHPLPDQTAGVWFTDPPYYDAIPYSDLSDFYIVWLNRTFPDSPLLRDSFDNANRLSPKTREIVQDETKYNNGQPKNRQWFEENMAKAFAEGRRVLNDNGIGSVVFAHKTTEGWEALLSGMIQGGWTITGSWPVTTERGARLRARESATLETSVHLICRPRPEDAPVGDWADVLGELPGRVGDWMERLQGEGVRGADLVFACVGPALEIYSRYAGVETAEGRAVGLPEYLEKVWEVVGRAALEQVLGTAEAQAQARSGTAGALEEDARLTALFLWTLQSTGEGVPPAGAGNDNDNGNDNGNAAGEGEPETGEEDADGDGDTDTDAEETAPRRRVSGYSLPFDVARRFAQPLGIHLEEWEARIIQTEKGVVRLRPVTERGRELFGEAGAGALADEIESGATASAQLPLFPEEAPAVRGRARRRGRGRPLVGASGAGVGAGAGAGNGAGDGLEAPLGATTLDRVHAAMLFQGSGRTEALRRLLRAEQERGPDFLRLANALTALYPRGSEEKRLLDGMLLAAPR